MNGSWLLKSRKIQNLVILWVFFFPYTAEYFLSSASKNLIWAFSSPKRHYQYADRISQKNVHHTTSIYFSRKLGRKSNLLLEVKRWLSKFMGLWNFPSPTKPLFSSIPEHTSFIMSWGWEQILARVLGDVLPRPRLPHFIRQPQTIWR